MTRREQVANLVAEGISNKEISLALGIRLRTVKAHLSWLYRKHQITVPSKRARLIRKLHQNLSPPPGYDSLTKREKQLVRLIVDGASRREIARRMQSADGTAKNRLCLIYDKLGVWSRYELAVKCLSK